MKCKIIIKVFGIIEVVIGFSAISFLFIGEHIFNQAKPTNVFIFVLATGLASLLIGIGILKHNYIAKKALIYFSGYIALTKILIFLDLMYFHGAYLTAIPTALKDSISFVYHILIIVVLGNKKFDTYFTKSS